MTKQRVRIENYLLEKYNELIKELEILIDKGQGESIEADDVRDKLDPIWDAMDYETQQKCREDN